MLHELDMRDQSPTILQTIYVWFLRILAAVCLVTGLIYWAQLVGLTNEGTMRFDLLQPHWRVVATLLAVVLPAAALGLWLTQAWGIVLWFVAIGVEIAAFGVWTNLYGAKPMLVSGHLLSLGILCLLLLVLYIQRRKLHAG